MAGINLKKFVNINIQPSKKSQISGTRGTVTIFTDYNVDAITEPININSFTKIMTVDAEPVEATNLNLFLTKYFNLGGDSAIVIPFSDTLTKADITALPNENILVAIVLKNGSETYTTLKVLAQALNADPTIYGINEKLLIARSDSYSDTDKVKNLVVKYSTTAGDEASIAAYLSRIDVYRIDSVKDYMFTDESLVIEPEDISNANYDILIANNYNVNIDLQGASRDCGGNCKDGEGVTNNFVRIVLHQTLTSRLLDLLTSKISGSIGISKIYAVLVDELKNYIANGYLSTDKIWTKEDLVIDGLTIITKGTPLINGYAIKIAPLTSQYITLKEAPPIYIVIADQYDIRYIEVLGEVI